MRLTALTLAALVAAGCGGDEPEEIPQTTPQPAPRQPMDTAPGDTTALTGRDTIAGPGQPQRPGEPQERARSEAGSGQPAAGEPGTGQPAAGEPTRQEASGERLYTVQVAAFTDPTSASEWTGRLRRQGLPVWTAMAELGGRTFYRVRVGAVPELEEARRLGTLLSRRYEWPVWVAPLTPSDRIPENAVRDTRRVLQGD